MLNSVLYVPNLAYNLVSVSIEPQMQANLLTLMSQCVNSGMKKMK